MSTLLSAELNMPKILCLALALTAAVLILAAAIGRLGGRFVRVRRWYCAMEWHSPRRLWEHTGFDGCSTHARCPWCKGVGLIDSQGNLFGTKPQTTR